MSDEFQVMFITSLENVLLKGDVKLIVGIFGVLLILSNTVVLLLNIKLDKLSLIDNAKIKNVLFVIMDVPFSAVMIKFGSKLIFEIMLSLLSLNSIEKLPSERLGSFTNPSSKE